MKLKFKFGEAKMEFQNFQLRRHVNRDLFKGKKDKDRGGKWERDRTRIRTTKPKTRARALFFGGGGSTDRGKG